MEEYILADSGPNWWHFRQKKEPDAISCSFTVTAVHDGTIILTGDMGTLAVRREYFPKDKNWFFGFPDEKTSIHYFAEKVCMYPTVNIQNWDYTRAVNEIKKYFSDMDKDAKQGLDLDALIVLDETFSQIFEDRKEMYEWLEDKFPGGSWHELDFGIDYKDHFKLMFELFKIWSKTLVQKEEKFE